jgi:putative nucleotidyltransferase with HDIG domain
LESHITGPADYVPIRVSTLRGDQKIDFNAFLKINDKFILYLRRGDSFEGSRLGRLKEKKLRKMFILADDEENYRQYLTRNIDLAYNKNSAQSLENRAAIVQGAQQSNAEEVMEDPDNVVAYDSAKDAAGKYVDFLSSEADAFSHVMSIENLDHNIAHHGVTVSTLAVALAKRLGTVDPKQTQLLALGSLIHDLGHHQTTLNLARPLHSFTPEEMTIYKTHPDLGSRKAEAKKHFDQTVINIIAQHEEYIDGRGFPLGLTESKLDPLAMILASANALDRLVTFEGIKRTDSVKHLMLNSVGKYPLNHIQLLGDIMKSFSI